jgi:inositol phosphorylceramide synthase catalytic subunit
MNSKATYLYSPGSIFPAAGFTILYFVLSFLLIGFKTDQLWLAVFFNVFYFLSSGTRKFIIGFSIFIVYWIIFDYMKAIPNYKINHVHIQDLYSAEKLLFGIHINGSTITPNEYWLANHKTFLDILTGIFYLCWIPVPLAFATYLFFKDKILFLKFSLSFVLINFIGFVIYYIYPAAPPWYIQQYGTDFLPGTPGNTAGLSRFDAYFHVSVFKNLYAKSSNVFAAMPSLHSSYPLLVLYYGIKKKVGWLNIIFAIVMMGIWFAAIYTSHHYILDVLAGIACAFTGIVLFDKVLMRSKSFLNFLAKYQEKISV